MVDLPPNDSFQRKQALAVMLVTLQFSCLGIIGFTGPWWPWQWWLQALWLCGLLIGALALIPFRHSRLSVSPVPPPNATLVKTGIYRHIRHPMYLGLILLFLSLILNHFTPMRCGVWLLLATVLLVKIHFEEKWLRQQYPQYKDYARHTARLIPWIW